MEMKISLNDHNTSQYLQIVLCIYNTLSHLLLTIIKLNMHVCTFLTLCNLYYASLFLYNRIDFLKEHKVLLITPIWLHLVYWKNVMLCKTPTCDGVCGIICCIILLAHLCTIIVKTFWYSYQYVTMLADAIANFSGWLSQMLLSL